MGKYINSFSGFINESKLAKLAGEYIDSTEIDPEMSDADLMQAVVQKIKDTKGDKAADDFVLKVAALNEKGSGKCKDCEEMMEPCEACKKHAAEMAANGDY